MGFLKLLRPSAVNHHDSAAIAMADAMSMAPIPDDMSEAPAPLTHITIEKKLGKKKGRSNKGKVKIAGGSHGHVGANKENEDIYPKKGKGSKSKSTSKWLFLGVGGRSKKKQKQKEKQRRNQRKNAHSGGGEREREHDLRKRKTPTPAPNLKVFLQQELDDDEERTFHTTSMTASLLTASVSHANSRMSVASSRASSRKSNSASASASASASTSAHNINVPVGNSSNNNTTTATSTSSKPLQVCEEGGEDQAQEETKKAHDDPHVTTTTRPSSAGPLHWPVPVHVPVEEVTTTKKKKRPTLERVNSKVNGISSSAASSGSGSPSPSNNIQLKTTPKLKKQSSSWSSPSRSTPASPTAVATPTRRPPSRHSSRVTPEAIAEAEEDPTFSMSMQRYHNLFKNKRSAITPQPHTRVVSPPRSKSHFKTSKESLDSNHLGGVKNVPVGAKQSVPIQDLTSSPLSSPLLSKPVSPPKEQPKLDLESTSISDDDAHSTDLSDHAVHLNSDTDSSSDDLLSFEPTELIMDMKAVTNTTDVSPETREVDQMLNALESLDSLEETQVFITNLQFVIDYQEEKAKSNLDAGSTYSSMSSVDSIAKHQLDDDSFERVFDDRDIMAGPPFRVLWGINVETTTTTTENVALDKLETQQQESLDNLIMDDNADVMKYNFREGGVDLDVEETTTTTTTTTKTITRHKKISSPNRSSSNAQSHANGGWIPNGALAHKSDGSSSQENSSHSSSLSFTSADFQEPEVDVREITQQYSSRSLEITTILEETNEDGSSSEITSLVSKSESLSIIGDRDAEQEMVEVRLDDEVALTSKTKPLVPSPRTRIDAMRDSMKKQVSWNPDHKVHTFEPDYELNIEMALSLVRSYDPRYVKDDRRRPSYPRKDPYGSKNRHVHRRNLKPLPSILRRSTSAPQETSNFNNNELSLSERIAQATIPVKNEDPKKNQMNNQSFAFLPQLQRSVSDPSKSLSFGTGSWDSSSSSSTNAVNLSKSRGVQAASKTQVKRSQTFAAYSSKPRSRSKGNLPRTVHIDGASTQSKGSSSASKSRSTASSLSSNLSCDSSSGKRSPDFCDASIMSGDSILSSATSTSDSVKYMVDKLRNESARRRNKARGKKQKSRDHLTASCYGASCM